MQSGASVTGAACPPRPWQRSKKPSQSKSRAISVKSVSLGQNDKVKAAARGNSIYWEHRFRPTVARDLGHTCRECKCAFTSVGEIIAVRRGGRIELRYHRECFSGTSDPRTQKNSSQHMGKWAGRVENRAPKGKYNKMRTRSHW